MSLETWVDVEFDGLVNIRHDLHRFPELLYDVERTAKKVADTLRSFHIDEVVEGIGRTGVVGVIKGNNANSNRAIGLRADMDALPIEEQSGKAWSSQTPGKMHACGHDGHTTMLLGAAKHLAATRDFSGTVILIFQPAEEGGAGGDAMVKDGLFDRWPCNEVYGMHNFPGIDVGKFAIASGPFFASADEIEITIEGRGGHAAMPEHTIDPLPISAALIQGIQAISSRNIAPIDSAVVSLTNIHAGDAFNVIPQSLSMGGTVRTLREAVRDQVEERLETMVSRLAEAFGAVGKLEYKRLYPMLENSEMEAGYAAEAARAVAGDDAVRTDMNRLMGGEDFAFMLHAVPGAMILLGNGPSANLHHPEYDFTDEAMRWGCSYWTELVSQRLR